MAKELVDPNECPLNKDISWLEKLIDRVVNENKEEFKRLTEAVEGVNYEARTHRSWIRGELLRLGDEITNLSGDINGKMMTINQFEDWKNRRNKTLKTIFLVGIPTYTGMLIGLYKLFQSI